MSTDTSDESEAITPSVEEVASKALATAREEFEKKEERIRELLVEGVSTFHEVDATAELHRAAQVKLETVVKELAIINIERSVLTEALGTSEASLSRRLPQRKRRQSRSKKKAGSNAVAAESDQLSSSTEVHSTSDNNEQERRDD